VYIPLTLVVFAEADTTAVGLGEGIAVVVAREVELVSILLLLGGLRRSAAVALALVVGVEPLLQLLDVTLEDDDGEVTEDRETVVMHVVGVDFVVAVIGCSFFAILTGLPVTTFPPFVLLGMVCRLSEVAIAVRPLPRRGELPLRGC